MTAPRPEGDERLETVKEAEARLGRRLTRQERAFKSRLDTVCACGHSGHDHTAVLLGGPDGSPCWIERCPCYSFPDGLTLAEKSNSAAPTEGAEGS